MEKITKRITLVIEYSSTDNDKVENITNKAVRKILKVVDKTNPSIWENSIILNKDIKINIENI